MINSKILIMGGYATGKRSFIETRLMHRSFPLNGFHIDSCTSRGYYSIKYSDDEFCRISISRECENFIESLHLSNNSKISITNSNEIIVPLENVARLINDLLHMTNQLPLFDGLTIFVNDPFIELFDIDIFNPFIYEENNTIISSDFFKIYDIIIFLIDAAHCLTSAEMELIAQIHHNKLLVVVNRMDLIKHDEIEELKKYIDFKLQNCAVSKIHYVSSITPNNCYC